MPAPYKAGAVQIRTKRQNSMLNFIPISRPCQVTVCEHCIDRGPRCHRPSGQGKTKSEIVASSGNTLFKIETVSSVDVRFTYYKLSKHSGKHVCMRIPCAYIDKSNMDSVNAPPIEIQSSWFFRSPTCNVPKTVHNIFQCSPFDFWWVINDLYICQCFRITTITNP